MPDMLAHMYSSQTTEMVVSASAATIARSGIRGEQDGKKLSGNGQTG